MGMDVQEAIKCSMKTEKNAMIFYQMCAEQIEDADSRRIFELLAREEREHVALFHQYYTGDDISSLDEFLNTPSDKESCGITSLAKLIRDDFCEKKALELAMERETELQKTLLETAAKIEDAEVRAVFEQNAQETYNHYLLIEAEYARKMGMVDESDMDTYVRE